jgi:lipopolysaccharide export system permease protein
MRQYERYVFMHLLLPTLLVTASLTGIVWLTQTMRFIDFMFKRGLSIGDFLYLTGLLLPSLLLILIPIALGIAVIYAYNRLTSESELVVLHAVGISRLQLARPALMMGIACTILCYALALAVMPAANKKFRDIRSFFRDKYASVLLEEEVFNTPIDGITVFIRERDNKGNLHDILLHDNRNPDAVVTIMAKDGRMEQSQDGPRFYLHQGVRQQWKDGRVSWLSFDNYAIDIAFYAPDVARDRDADERTLSELFAGNPAKPAEDRALHAEGHQRLTWPLLNITLPLLALSLLIAGEFNRRGQWKRIGHATMAMVAVIIIYFVLRNTIVKQPWLTPALYLTVLVPMLASARLLHTGRPWWVKRRKLAPQPQMEG